MPIHIREAREDEIDLLVPLLLQAEPSESALSWSLAHLSDTAYRMDDGARAVGAATMRWRSDPCEIVELAIVPDRHGQGLGKQFVAWLIGEARRRGKREVLVGTGSTSANNIIFYQKCGFRIDHIRKDYFWYYDEPIYEHGIRIQDMIVFRYDLSTTGG
jgi:N-acetylglutamate synthase-like GNAT family acetyltransferase